eukprot:1840220-Rhodomonas_salina.3
MQGDLRFALGLVPSLPMLYLAVPSCQRQHQPQRRGVGCAWREHYAASASAVSLSAVPRSIECG